MKLLWTTKKNFLWRNLPRAIDGIKLLFDSERCLDHTYFLFIFFSSKKGNEGKKVFFSFLSAQKSSLQKWWIFWMFIAIGYIQNKNYSLSPLLLLHTNFEKNKILLVKNVYSISPNNALFIHFYFFSLYNRTSYYFFSLDFLFIVVLLSSFSLCFSCILVSIFYTFDVSLCFIFFSWLCKKIQGTFYTLEKILLFFFLQKKSTKKIIR